jgi:hypothetical protein
VSFVLTFIVRCWNDVRKQAMTYCSIFCLFLFMTLESLDFGRFFSFFILHTVHRTPWMGDQRDAAAYTQNDIHTSNPRVGFELTTPVFQRANTVHALDRAATVTCHIVPY